MGTDWKWRRAPVRRPKKTGAARRQREKVQAKRLVKLGVAAETVARMGPTEVRDALKRPAKTARRAAVRKPKA